MASASPVAIASVSGVQLPGPVAAADDQQGGRLTVERVECGARRGSEAGECAEGLEAGHVLGLAEADQQGDADADGRHGGAGAGQLPGGAPGGFLVAQGQSRGVRAQGAVGHHQPAGPLVEDLGGSHGVGVAEGIGERGGDFEPRLFPGQALAGGLRRGSVGQGTAVARDTPVRLAAAEGEGVVVEGDRPGGERLALVADAHRAEWDSIP